MSPTPQESTQPKHSLSVDSQHDNNDIVISGISGVYPKCRYVKDLDQILYDKVNPITKDVRWQYNHPEAAQHGGNVPSLDRFDAQFFKVHYHLGQVMDPMGRMILEQAYQAIYDAGVNPHQLSGKKVGVYIGTSFSETEKFNLYASNKSGFSMPGCSKTMLANRISYWLNAKGPSVSIDVACCSATVALEQAFFSLSRGECEAAIVGGSSLSLHPQFTVQYSRIVPLNEDGKTKSFDQNADGNVKSEAVNVIFLQKAKDAIRIYAHIKHVKCEFREVLEGKTGPRYGYYRDPEDTAQFLKDFYDEIQIPPWIVEYVEGFGSAVAESDKSELEAIDKVFCAFRNEPLLIGSVMSNIGYGEAASGLSAIIKVLLGYHRGILAGNLHCETPRTDVSAFHEGRMKLLTDHHQFHGTYAAVNSMSVTGVNAHVLLCGTRKLKDINRYNSDIPRLVTISGRQESSVLRAINHLKSHVVDPEELALLNNIHKDRITGHLGRGYVILDTNEKGETESLSESACYFDGPQRPLWFVYSGMGSQWAGMGKALMRIPVFANAIERCHRALLPKGLNIVDIITSSDPTTFDNILHSFVGIAAVQIGLTDVLNELGLVPDKIIGHSAGELGCAYADGGFTAEEMILASYSRGLASVETKFIRGSMAAVGLGYDQVSKMCPPGIEVACHNSSESSTLSGPEDEMREFVNKLTRDGIFAKEVPCSNIAYHSRYISNAGPALLKHLNEVIKNPKERSDRWISTSVPKEKWNEPIAKYSSAEYHANNLLNPVLFEEGIKLIPSNAVLVEVAPHGLLQSILKRSLPVSCITIPLTRRGHPDNARLVLEAIGKLFTEGFHPDLQSLYPKVEFPVSNGTPFLSTYVDWAHGEKWCLPLLCYTKMKTKAASCKHIISTYDDDYFYLKDHVIRKKICLPSAFVLVAVWDTLAMVLGVPKKKFSVEFDDVRFYCQPSLHDQRQIRLYVTLHRGNGHFEVMDDHSKVAIGFIKSIKKFNDHNDTPVLIEHSITLSTQDVYKLFEERNYSYSGEFQSIFGVSDSITEAKLFWNDNWVTLIDGMLQLNALKNAHSTVSRPERIRSMVINVNTHIDNAEVINNKKVLPAKISDVYDLTRCGGIVIQGLRFHNLPQLAGNKLTLKVSEKVPRFNCNGDSISSQNAMLQSEHIGNIESLKWIETPEIITTRMRVKVHYAGINVDDVRKATGIKSADHFSTSSYGMDFSGITETGERVMGLVEDGSTRRMLQAYPDLTWQVPSHWSLEDAATVPLAYVYVFYCFFIKTVSKRFNLKSVLIHGGSGALGQAAINVALASGYKVFTTVSDVHKKKFLLKLFPELKEENIGNSRDISFSDMVLASTGGKGLGMVLSCVRGDLKDFSLKCCGYSGVTFDADQLSTAEQYKFGLQSLTEEKTYIVVDIRSIFSNSNTVKRISQLMVDGICGGWVRPLTRLTFAIDEAPHAFRLLAASKHRGRVLLKLTDNIPSTYKLVCLPYHNHLIVGDNESLVLRLAERLVDRGAKNIHLHLPQSSALLLYKISSWKNHNIKIKATSNDLEDEYSVETVVKNAIDDGNLAGVYIVNVKLKDILVQKFDAATRKVAPRLRHFLILEGNKNDENIQQMCLRRSKDGLAATYLNVSSLKTDEDSVNARDIIEAIELSLSSQQPVATAQLTPSSYKPLHKQIASLVGINIHENASKTESLQELGLQQEKSQIISTYLNDMFNVYVDDNDVPLLTLKRLEEIETADKEKEYDETEGFECFYTFVDPDELLSTTAMVFLPTRSNSSVTSEDVFDSNETYLWIVPGMEGHHNRFRNLSERLKLPVVVLQPGLDYLQEDPHHLASRYYKIVIKQTEKKKKFYILGFESGVSVALELAGLLEKQGLTGTLYCVGDGPKETTEFIEEKLKKFANDEELETCLIKHMFRLLMSEECDDSEVERVMVGCSSWSQRVERCVRILLGRVSHSAQYMQSLIDAAYWRIHTARQQLLSPKVLESQIVLIRAQTAHKHSARTSLQDYSSQQVILYDLPTPLAQITEDLRCSAIINRHLSKNIIEAFNERSQCESYPHIPDHVQ